MTSFTHYILDGTKVVAQYQTTTSSITPSNVIYFYYDESGSPTGMKYNGNVYFFQKNLQGDIIRILNTQGSIVATYTYDAWGNIIASTDTSGVSIGTKNPFRYRGYYYDTETGLYYLNSRYYDPQVGRFLNADGFVSTGQGLLGSNMFAYCGNNPVVYVDYAGDKPHRVDEKFILTYSPNYASVIALAKYNSINHTKEYSLDDNWFARFDYGKVGNKDHVHVYNKSTKEEWVMNMDGSMSHENKSNKGSPPKKRLKKLKKLTGFDYKKVRQDFLDNDKSLCGFENGVMVVEYSDGTIYVNSIYYYSNSPNYSDDLWMANENTVMVPHCYFLPIFPATFISLSYELGGALGHTFEWISNIFTITSSSAYA